MHTPFTLWMNFSLYRWYVMLTVWLCKYILHCNIFILYMFMTCSTSYCLVTLKDLWNVYMYVGHSAQSSSVFLYSDCFLALWSANLEHQDSTLVWFPDLLQSGQEAQGQWCCWRMCSWSSSKQNDFTTDRTWGKLACASEWTHLNSGDAQNTSAWGSDSSNCASYWFHAISRYLDMACCFITPSDGESSEICNGGN